MPIKTSSAKLCTDPYEIYICIEGALPKAMNKVMRSHWRKNHQDGSRWKELIQRAVLTMRPAIPLTKASISITRHSYRMLDYDGLVASMKPLVDGLKGFVIEDDTWKVTGPWKVDQKFRSKAHGHLLEVWVREIKSHN